MKKFVLQSILLISTIERKAKKVNFHSKRTIILGKNDTGKSSLIKSIYKAFGAEPYIDNPKWKRLNPIIVVSFLLDNEKYLILRDGNQFAIFDKNEKLISLFSSVTNELGPFLSKLFDFKIILPNRKGELITPPPAFLFLPYYIDQDIGWQKSWSSFNKLQQIKTYREPIINYHVGLKPNEYYDAKNEITAISEKMEELDKERKLSQNILKKLRDKISHSNFDINIESFQNEIKELLIECQTLKKKQDTHKSKLVDLYNNKTAVETNIELTKQALNEVRKDYQFATHMIVEDYIDCPTCGTHFDNSFASRLEIAKDEGKCKDLLVEFHSILKKIKNEIEEENNNLNETLTEIEKIEEILDNRKEEIKLRDLIENAGRTEVKNVFADTIDELLRQITENAIEQKKLQEKLDGYLDKERQKSIKDDYLKYMNINLMKLDVLNVEENDYKNITAQIKETGSALPRLLMAYYFSIFQVMKKHSTTTFCPIVIDSPNQQAQDQGHIDKILKHIKENQVEESQLILGLEELYDVDFECPIVELEEKYSLLQKNEFEISYEEITPLLEQIWNNPKIGRLF